MKRNAPNIITVGLSPCWDITCEGENLRWGGHQKLSRQTVVPAGKALNVLRALSEMTIPGIAAGFWGARDYERMRDAVAEQMPRVICRFTTVPGLTRQNITLIDRNTKKEMHLRAPSEPANPRAFKRVYNDLGTLLRKDMICVFAGAMPPSGCAKDVQRLVSCCREKGVKAAMDSSGPIFRQAVQRGSLWLIKPNVEELRELLGKTIPDRTRPLIEAAKSLLNRVEMVLLSRGAKGAWLITRHGIWGCRHVRPLKNIQSTVGCGDYLLAGFLAGWIRSEQPSLALQQGMRMASFRLRGSAGQEKTPSFSRTLSDSNLKMDFWNP